MTALINERGRVLHAALRLPTFTVGQLADLSGVNARTVQTTVDRAKDMIERVSKVKRGKPGGQQIVYQLRESARQQLATQALDLARQLREVPAPSSADTVRHATEALDALESSIELSEEPGSSGDTEEAWHARAQRQVRLSRQLIELVADQRERDRLGKRLGALERQLTKPREVQMGWLDCWQELLSDLLQHRPAVAKAFAPELLTPAPERLLIARRMAPALVLEAIDDVALTNYVAGEFSANRVTLRADLQELMAELKERPLRLHLLNALQNSPEEAAVVVMLDSNNVTSQSTVRQFLDVMREVLWVKGSSRPAVIPEVTLIDKTIDRQLVLQMLRVRNLNYLTNIRDSNAFAQVAPALGRFRVDDSMQL
jgi:hypothetical protein